MKKLPVEYVEARKKYILFKNDLGVTTSARNGWIYEDFMYRHLREIGVDLTGTNVIDIGGNFGFHTLEFADLAGHVYSFEPQKIIYYQLCGNIVLNGYTNITAYNIALDDSQSPHKMLMENPDYTSDDSINIGNSHLNAWTHNGNNEVEVRSLDSYEFDNVSFMKIDVQGYEVSVLNGARRTIAKNRPVIFIEVEDGQLSIYGYKPEDVFSILSELNYSYTKIGVYDYIALPSERF